MSSNVFPVLEENNVPVILPETQVEMESEAEKYQTEKRIQGFILEMFKEFAEICERHNLRYFAIGGTCLGAVRHKGFIPWDDDLDVGMPFEDYVKFREIAKKELTFPFSLYDPYEHYRYGNNFIKIQNDSTTLIEKGYRKYPDRYTGIYIDVMPIYGMPRGETAQKQASIDCDNWVRMHETMAFPCPKGKPLKTRLRYLYSNLVKLVKPFYYYMQKIDVTFGQYPFEHSDKILFGWRLSPKESKPNYTYKHVFPYQDFSDYVELPFEDTTIRAPKGYDRYLTMDFGDYMKLPPEEKRTAMHAKDVLDFEKPYKKYIEEGYHKC